MNLKQHAPLLLALAVPVCMVLFVAGAIYLPGLFIHPQYNFLYSAGDYDTAYYVSNGALVQASSSYPYAPKPPAFGNVKLYVYDVKADAAREISYADAAKLQLDSNAISPDGYRTVYGGSGGGFFPFFYSGGDYNSVYLETQNASRKLNIQPGIGGSYYNFRFLGWITNPAAIPQ